MIERFLLTYRFAVLYRFDGWIQTVLVRYARRRRYLARKASHRALLDEVSQLVKSLD